MPLQHSVEEIILKNGARGLLVDVPAATVVAYDVQFRAGNYFTPGPEVQQTAHLMEHMVFGGTKHHRSLETFSQEFNKNGARSNARTYQYEMGYEADCAVMEWDRILDLQRQAITEPLFTEALLAAEKGNVLEELTGQANNHRRVLYQALYRAMGDQSFLDAEKLSTIDAVGLKHIKAHHKRTHTLRNMRFCFTGDLKSHRKEIVRMLEAWDLPEGERLSIPVEPLHSTTPVHLFREDMPSAIFQLNIALNRTLTLEEEVTMGAINHLLTGTFHSRIWGKARKLGICYGMGASLNIESDGTSTWQLAGQIRPQNAERMFTLIASELKKVARGAINQKELDDAKQFALGNYQQRGQTVRAINDWYADYYFSTTTIDPLYESPDRIQETSLEAIVALVQEFLTQGEWGIGVIGTIDEAAVLAMDEAIATVCKTR